MYETMIPMSKPRMIASEQGVFTPNRTKQVQPGGVPVFYHIKIKIKAL